MATAALAADALRAAHRALWLASSGVPDSRELALEAAATLRTAASTCRDVRDRASLEAISERLAEVTAHEELPRPWLAPLLASALGGAVGMAGALLSVLGPRRPSMGQEAAGGTTTAIALGAMVILGTGLGALGFFHRQEWWGAVALGAGSSVVGGAGVLLVNRLIPDGL